MWQQLQKLILRPRADKIFLCLLAIAYAAYVGASGHVLNPWLSTPSDAITEHSVDTNPNIAIQYWTAANMQSATDGDQLIDQGIRLSEQSSNTSQAKAAQQEGQPPSSGESSYPLSTVGKVFFTSATGQDYVCSGTALVSSNHSVVDTAGHCLYWNGGWVRNMIFCPLYDHGNPSYGCWAARDLEVPADWIDRQSNDLHHDFGMAVVAPSSQGDLTDLVGGAGWAYNQPVNQPFHAYGYPAGYPFDGQTRKFCKPALGTAWQHGGGTVVSIPCDMTGGSSGGPWFIQIGDNLYVNGHNDFTSSLQYGHMFSPYYDDTWYALYNKAQQT